MKFDVSQIVLDYFRIICGKKLNIFSAFDFIFIFVLPIVCAASTYFFSSKIDNGLFINLFTLLGVFTAVFMAILGVLVPLYHAPRKCSQEPEVDERFAREHKTRGLLIHETGVILSYMMLVSVCAMGMLLFAIIIKSDLFLFKWIAVLVTVHVFVNIFVLLKRMHALIHYEFDQD